MPEPLVRPACVGAPASLDPALRIAHMFRVSARAGALRFTELSDTSCAAVLPDRGTVLTMLSAPGAAFAAIPHIASISPSNTM